MKVVVLTSGGKDSTVTLLLALKKYGRDKVIPIFTDTGNEAQETYEYLKYLEKTLSVKILRLKENTLHNLIREFGRFPSPRFRFCTRELKIKPLCKFLSHLNGYIEVWIGIRKDESLSRQKRFRDKTSEEVYPFLSYIDTVSRDITKELRRKLKEKQLYVRFPILEWTEEDVFNFLRTNGIKPNPLYGKGFSRVGCYPCILTTLKEWALVWESEEGKENILKLIALEEELKKKNKNAKLTENYTGKEILNKIYKIKKERKFIENQQKLFCLCQI